MISRAIRRFFAAKPASGAAAKPGMAPNQQGKSGVSGAGREPDVMPGAELPQKHDFGVLLTVSEGYSDLKRLDDMFNFQPHASAAELLYQNEAAVRDRKELFDRLKLRAALDMDAKKLEGNQRPSPSLQLHFPRHIRV